jgi:hypothetical protein
MSSDACLYCPRTACRRRSSTPPLMVGRCWKTQAARLAAGQSVQSARSSSSSSSRCVGSRAERHQPRRSLLCSRTGLQPLHQRASSQRRRNPTPLQQLPRSLCCRSRRSSGTRRRSSLAPLLGPGWRQPPLQQALAPGGQDACSLAAAASVQQQACHRRLLPASSRCSHQVRRGHQWRPGSQNSRSSHQQRSRQQRQGSNQHSSSVCWPR